jgi:catechol 2,3-dioxygenase-like lactoylglutathione lyase family enzyme
MITGAHAVLYSSAAEEARAFFRDALGFKSVDAGGGWLVFALPPAELAVHPAEGGGDHELFLMCDDIDTTIEELKIKGVEFTEPISEQSWGRLTAMRIPGGAQIRLYEPRHPTTMS